MPLKSLTPEQTSKVYNLDKETLFDILYQALVMGGIPISQVDKITGTIISEYIPMNTKELYKYSGFSLWADNSRGKLTIIVKELNQNQTKLIIGFYIESYWTRFDGQWHIHQSNGKFEKEIFDAIEKKFNK